MKSLLDVIPLDLSIKMKQALHHTESNVLKYEEDKIGTRDIAQSVTRTRMILF